MNFYNHSPKHVHFISGMLFMCMLFITFGACTEKRSWNFSTANMERIIHLYNDTAKPGCEINISIDYPAGNKDLVKEETLRQILLERCLGPDFSKFPVEQAVETYATAYGYRYKSDLEAEYLREAETSEFPDVINNWFSYVNHIQGNVKYLASDLLIYKVSTHEYTGGAHGISQAKFYNIELPNLKIIKLTDIFVENYEEIMTDLIKSQLMNDFKVTSLAELEEAGIGVIGEITPTENFFFNEHGIVFYYNVYEIAPYAQGPVEVCVPYEMLASILTESFPKSLQ